jgi:DNA (cytosine-5)-methyltransferase 1
MVFYNDNDPFVARWLTNLIAAGHLPPGKVDGRSVVEIQPDDCAPTSHFFAGIGGWALALRLAGWPSDVPIWTASLPCQPFSVAGRRSGEEDERHLWPAFHRLVEACRPAVLIGEQVASGLGRDWLARVRDDLDILGYVVGAADLCAAGVGAPHIRQRLYWVAHANGWNARAEGLRRGGEHGQQSQDGVGLADARSDRRRGRGDGDPPREGRALQTPGPSASSGLADAEHDGGRPDQPGAEAEGRTPGWWLGAWNSGRAIECADGKARRIEPSIQPLAHGVPGRMGRLRAYGNAIVPQVAAAFVTAFMQAVEMGG